MTTRKLLFDAIDEARAAANAKGVRFAVLMIEVQGLQQQALQHGYAYGDHAAEAVRDRLQRSLRPCDHVFAMGGSRLAVVLPALLNSNHVLLAVARIAETLETPIPAMHAPWRARAVSGIAWFPDHGVEADALCRKAELALLDALRTGELHSVHAPGEADPLISYDALRDAIETGRLSAFFQPIIDLQTRAIIGVESLARWHCQPIGHISPAHFVPFAEQSDLIGGLTRWSIHTTLRHASALLGRAGLVYSINFSPQILTRAGSVEQLMDALDIWALPPSQVIVEVTETALINDMEQSVKVLRRLRDKGVGVAIDDFGTGYASVGYLRHFPATELKIDKSLVDGICNDVRSEKLTQAIVQMAHHMDMQVVAEGIEDQLTQDALAAMGCDFGQGYHLGRPQPAEEFVRRYNRLAAS